MATTTSEVNHPTVHRKPKKLVKVPIHRKPVVKNVDVDEARNYEELISRPFSSQIVTETTHQFNRNLRPNYRPVQALHSDDFVTRVIGENQPTEVIHAKPKHKVVVQTTTLPTTTTTTTTTTTAAPVEVKTEEAVSAEGNEGSPREVIESDPSYIRETRSQLISDDAKIPLLIPVRKRLPESSQYTVVSSSNGQPENPSYVSSDVYTIETTTKYRPRTMHSNSIFYQKALAYLKAYKKELVSRRPLGPSYRLNANSDEPAHIVTAYGEIPPVVAADSYTYDSVTPSNSLNGNKLYQQQEIEQPSAPNHEDVLSVTDQDREVIGYLPVIRLPRKKEQSSSRGSNKQQQQQQENIPYASASAASSSSSSSSSASSSSSSSSASTPVNESSIMGKKPISPSASSYLSPSLRLRKQSSPSSSSSSTLHHRSNRIIEPLTASSSQSFGYSPIVSFVEPRIPVLTVSMKKQI